MVTFGIGETLVWIHVDEDLNRKVNDFVKIIKAPEPNAKSMQYQVLVLRTNEPDVAFSDELYRWEKQ